MFKKILLIFILSIFFIFIFYNTSHSSSIYFNNDTIVLKNEKEFVSFYLDSDKKRNLIKEVNKQGLSNSTYIFDYYEINNKIHKYEIYYEDNICLVIYEFYDECDGKEIILKDCKEIILKIKDMIT